MVTAVLRLVFVNLLGNLLLVVRNLARLPRFLARPSWVRIPVDTPLVTRAPRRRLLQAPGASLARLDETLDDLAGDPRIDGVVVELRVAPGGWARTQSLRQSLLRLRERGKRVVVHLSSPGLHEVYVATAADDVLADESGPIALTGLALQATFWRQALAKVGVEVQAEYRGEYKSFAESFTRDDMSEPHREALEAVLAGLYDEAIAAVAEGRRLDRALAPALLTGGPYTAAEAEQRGLLDGVAYPDEVDGWIARRVGRPVRVATLAGWRRARLLPLRWRPVLRPHRRVRVVSLQGNIVPGEGSDVPRKLIGAVSAARVLAAARTDRRVAAVVLHVDSRGGSAAASDLIWREVTRLAQEKPVVAYLDDVAASGGYYVACAAHRIIAQGCTLTGSIGVVAGKVTVEALHDRLGVRTVTLKRGEVAAMNTPTHRYSDEERRRLTAEVEARYRQFVAKVAQGRKLDPEAVEAAARGRVWLGRDALAHGLLDALGGMTDALAAARALAQRTPREVLDVEDARVAHRRGPLWARLLARAIAAAPTTSWLADLDALRDVEAWAADGTPFELLDDLAVAVRSREHVLYLATSLRTGA